MTKPQENTRKTFKAEGRHPETGRRRRTFHRSKKAATRAAAESTLEEAQRSVLGTTTLKDATLAFITRLRQSGLSDKANNIEAAFRIHILPRFGQTMLRSMSSKRITQIARAIAAINRSRSRLAMIIGWFFEVLRDGFMDVPLSIRFACEIRNLFPRKAHGMGSMVAQTRLIPIGATLDCLLNKASGVLRVALWIMAHAGLRIGEARALLVSDIDFDTGLLHVRATVTKKNIRKGPKTRHGLRSVPINSALRRELKDWVAGKDPNSPVLSNATGRLLTYGELVHANSVFGKSFPGPSFNFHTYRSACVTIWIFAGISLNLIRTWIGHSHIRITVQVYGNAIAVADELWLKRKGAQDQGLSPAARISEALWALEPS